MMGTHTPQAFFNAVFFYNAVLFYNGKGCYLRGEEEQQNLMKILPFQKIDNRYICITTGESSTPCIY